MGRTRCREAGVGAEVSRRECSPDGVSGEGRPLPTEEGAPLCMYDERSADTALAAAHLDAIAARSECGIQLRWRRGVDVVVDRGRGPAGCLDERSYVGLRGVEGGESRRRRVRVSCRISTVCVSRVNSLHVCRAHMRLHSCTESLNELCVPGTVIRSTSPVATTDLADDGGASRVPPVGLCLWRSRAPADGSALHDGAENGCPRGCDARKKGRCKDGSGGAL